MLKKSHFFEFFNRSQAQDFETLSAVGTEDEDFINWNEFLMPQHYGHDQHGTADPAEYEYLCIRNSAAICDVSPIRKIRVRGSHAGEFFDHLLTRPVSTLPAMRATYTVLCEEDGNMKDDAILYKYADDDYLIMPSDIDHSPYFEALAATLALPNVGFTECTDDLVGLAIQGPLSALVLQQLGFKQIELLRPFDVRAYNFYGGIVHVSRVGFTADLGYECWFKPSLSDAMKAGIEATRTRMDCDIPGYGLGALEACRLEGAFIVAGWDCASEIDPQPGFERSPYELGLGWLVNLEAANFVGREALLAQKENGTRHVLRTFEFESNCPPDAGTKIYTGPNQNGSVIGTINCSAWSWGLQKLIGNASIHSEHAAKENAWITVAGQHHELKISSGAFIELKRRNQVPAPLHS